MARPQTTVSPEAIVQMSAMLEEAQRKTERLLLSVKQLSVPQRRQLLAQMQEIVTGMDTATGVFLQQWVPYHYVRGSEDMIRKMVKARIAVKAASMTALDQEAMQAITDRMFDAFAQSFRVFQRSFSSIVNTAQRQELNQRIAEGVAKGEARQTVQKAVKQSLAENELFVLRDSAGKRWSMQAYGEMLTRTEMANTSREGRGNRAIQNAVDLVQIDGYGSDHQVCRDWEFKVVSLTGATPGYPTLDDATADGLFHPNCKHNYNPYNAELAAL